MKFTPPLHLVALLAAIALGASPALAQTTPAAPSAPLTGFWLTTPYPELTLPAGEKGSIPLTLRNAGLPPQRAELSIAGLPAGWTADFTGSGKPVTAAMVDPDDTQNLTLEVTPPKGASDKAGAVQATVSARYGDQTASLPLSISLSTAAPGGVTLTPELPALRGTPTTDFSFRIKIENDSGADQMFNLGADVPPGFTTSFKHGYDTAEITGVPIKAGASDTVTLDVKPGPNAAAGDYPIHFAVLAGKLTASTDLGIRITGTPELTLTGPQGRLSGDTTAGQATSFPFTLQSTGSSPAENVKLSANAPGDWKVTFDPETLPKLDAGQSQTVNVTVTPSAKAVAGDYMVTVDANADGVAKSAEFRATVNTSTQWGIVGVIIIAAALIVLVLGVMRYGRR